ncbi:unnamed protein product [Vitrella brassicaformis CCMP3155]|uniref:Uncharacterized protein n=1 Tax=Vitrella brassicaformis (strain CCMP3155) TaxID=1169540 RepID=A0A0G4H274_VITBC|nr:unnamed protein product [Vitrella brassicaformis CCMP3155]|eukprot:CEM37636.1 unnamed protein product [Vitrella brassicaformis CCMP3155]
MRLTFTFVAALSLAAAAAAVSSSAFPRAFLTPVAQRVGIAGKPNGLRIRHRPLQAVTPRFKLERGVEAFNDIGAILRRFLGKAGPSPTDEEVLQWLTDSEAILVQILQGKRPPGSDKDFEVFKAWVSAFYFNCVAQCLERGLDFSFRPEVFEYSYHVASAAMIDNGFEPSVEVRSRLTLR